MLSATPRHDFILLCHLVVGDMVDCLDFPYRNPVSAVVNEKFRSLETNFCQVKDGEKLLWLIDQVDAEHGNAVDITEGELNALALREAGIANAVSVLQSKGRIRDCKLYRRFKSVFPLQSEERP